MKNHFYAVHKGIKAVEGMIVESGFSTEIINITTHALYQHRRVMALTALQLGLIDEEEFEAFYY